MLRPILVRLANRRVSNPRGIDADGRQHVIGAYVLADRQPELLEIVRALGPPRLRAD